MADSFDMRIRSLIADQLCIEPHEVQPDATLDGLGADDLDRVEIAMALEEELEIEIEGEQEHKWVTVGDVLTTCRFAFTKKPAAEVSP